MKIIVTIPAYNEEDTIGEVIQNTKKTMSKANHHYEIQVLDDGSTDQTKNIAQKLGANVFSHQNNRGLAQTFRDEIKYALENNADIIVHIDADGQYLTDEILNLLKPIIDGEADFVLGSRFMGTIEDMPFIKKLGNRAFSRVVSKITKTKISDAQTGFRAFTRDVAEEVDVNSNFTYTQEQIIKAVEKNFRIKEIPIYFARRSAGTSRLMTNPFDYAIRAGVNLIRIYRDYVPLKFFGAFGFLFILGGFLLFLYSLLYLDYFFDNTIILLFIVGVQITLFGFLAEMIKNESK
ncbi:glycosyltransferase involved in cell wall biosynthesis [Methanocalculus sp. AMF5]|uniref:glycosyltransferase family 2 protein n=2 Tax=unclassified Methanocalculus TaxID=2631035 RepID=UPI00209F8CBA|nr:glycosyltransferase family 2 protein [Methanocalculus sp. AMF5]MCP1663173.1 glycosyltransferase involved in cell wall biosynthesis [Methanocalculus sp. AMF5]